MEILGIDVGGTGIKGAIYDLTTGEQVSEKLKYGTPSPSTPESVLEVVNQLFTDLNWHGKLYGCGFPSVVKDNICLTASNIDKSWLGMNLKEYFNEKLGCPGVFLNDADAAGLAEVCFGAGKDIKGTIMMITLGTGIGSGLFRNGILIPNTELGHLKYKKTVYEHYASNSARKNKKLTWSKWGQELNNYLNYINFLFSPNLIIIGGGISKKFEEYAPFIDVPTTVVPATLQNDAGILGCAYYATLELEKMI